MDRSLKLSEKLFCLAVNPENGGIFLNASSVLSVTITGSVFVELLKKGLISVEKGKVQVIDPTVQDDEIHEYFMKRIRLRPKGRKMRTWILYFNLRGRKIQRLFIRSLVRKNLLRIEEKRILFFAYKKIYLVNRELVENIRRDVEITSLGKVVSSDEILILSLMVSKTNLLFRVFSDRVRRKEASRFLKNLPETDISMAVREAIEMMHATVFSATS